MGFAARTEEATKRASAGVGSARPAAGVLEYMRPADELQHLRIASSEIRSIAETGRRNPSGEQRSIGIQVEGDPYDATVQQ